MLQDRLALLALASLACAVSLPRELPAPAGPTAAPPGVRASPTLGPWPMGGAGEPTRTPVPPEPDLDHYPLHWFAPLPRQQPPAYHGSLDYMDLFSPEADWETAASHLQVFKFYGGWVATDSTEAERRQAFSDVSRRGLAIAVEAGPLIATAECGEGVESFAGDQGVETVRKIRDSGATLHLIALDEPYFYGHIYDGVRACRWPAEEIARGVGEFIARVRAIFPDVIVGDIEPVTGLADAAAYREWLDTFEAVNGYDLAFLHSDIAWGHSDWPERALAMETQARQAGVPVGIIYNGNWNDPTDVAWLSVAGERAKRYQLQAGGRPDHVIFQSWNDKPDRVLPESDRNTFTGFVRTYFEDLSALGYSAESLAGNVSYGKPVRVSRLIPGFGGENAVDLDPGTVWESGAGAPQWIEIDLGAAYDIRELRLLPGQGPAGRTVHRVRGRGPGTGDVLVTLYTFDGQTADMTRLAYSPPQAWSGIQVIRIESVSSPSWIAWREIEVIAVP